MTDRPWMTALEMQFSALRLAVDTAPRTPPGASLHAQNRPRRIRALRQADSFAWTSIISSAVFLASKSIPANSSLSRDMLPGSGYCWFWFGSSLPINPYAGGDKTIQALLLAPFDVGNEHGLEVTAFMKTDDHLDHLYPWTSWIWPFGTALDRMDTRQEPVPRHMAHLEAAGRAAIFEASRFILAASTWMAQKVVTWTSGHVERHRRKQLSREHGAVVSDVKVVQLRRAEHESRPPIVDGESVDWSCRWIVNGHWRNQPYKAERKLIYILPYVKGPDDKPLKVPTHTVYAVNR